MTRCTVLTIPLLLTLGCSTAKTADERGHFTRKAIYTVQAFSKVTGIEGKSFTLEESPPDQGMEFEADVERIGRFLVLEGLKQLPAGTKNPDYTVSVTFEKKEPSGLALGNINPYIHGVVIRGKLKGVNQFETRCSGPSELKTRGWILPRLLAVCSGNIGKSTSGIESYEMADNDEKVEEIKKELY